MNLGELISALKERGNATMSWYGIETNIDSVGELKDKDGKLFVELKIKEQYEIYKNNTHRPI